MRCLSARRLVMLSLVIGSVLGFAYAQHLNALSIAHMKARWGWACGTGLHERVVILSVLGRALGGLLGAAALSVCRRMRRWRG